MMNCSEKICDYIDKYDSKFKGMAVLNKERCTEIALSCGIIDKFSDEYNFITVDFWIDSKTGRLTIEIVSDDLTLDNEYAGYIFKIIDYASSLEFRHMDSEHIKIVLCFEGIWDFE